MMLVPLAACGKKGSPRLPSDDGDDEED